jgi:hypothetical protein
MHFITTTDASKPSSITKRFIRSKVMQGKNTGKRPQTKRDTKPAGWMVKSDFKRDPPADFDCFVEAYAAAVPVKIGSELSLVQFAAGIDTPAFRKVVFCKSAFRAICAIGDLMCNKVFDLQARASFPLVSVTGFNRSNVSSWLLPLQTDAAFLHASIHAAEVFMDIILDRQYPVVNQDANKHAWLGIRILRKRLASTAGQGKTNEVTNSTLAAVLVLALSALITADIKAYQLHMQALHEMVRLRGGVAGLRGNKLLVEIFRYDLSGAVLFGTKPVFFNDPKSEPLLPCPDDELFKIRKSSFASSSVQLPAILDANLTSAWSVMQRFTSIVNLATNTKHSIVPQLIYDTMTSVMYRLIRKSFDHRPSDEAVRLGLLFYTHHIFLRWEYLKTPDSNLAATIRTCLQNWDTQAAIDPNLMLWLLMISAVSIFSVHDAPWLKVRLQRQLNMHGITAWKDARAILKSFLWIDLLYDKPGIAVFELLQKD